MIKVNDKFSIKKDEHNWILVTKRPSTGKRGKKPTKPFTETKTYHMNLEQIANRIVESSCETLESLEEIKGMLSEAKAGVLSNLLNRIK